MSLANRIDALATRLPEADPRKAEFRRRIAALADECGCEMSGAFIAVALVLSAAYLLLVGVGLGSAIGAIVFVLVAGVVGKAIGLGVARLRLLWLGRVLAARLSSVQAG
jgi:hypothetical protein